MSQDEISGRAEREPFLSRGGRTALVLGAVVLASSVGAVRLADRSPPGGAAPTPSAAATRPVGTTAPAAPTSSARVGFIGLPPAGAAPSSPRSGELVVAVRTRQSGAWLYADGRLVTLHHEDRPEGANPDSTGLLERRLTRAGVERLRSYVARSGNGLGPAPTRPAIAPSPPLVRVDGLLRAVDRPSPACDARRCPRVTDPGSWLPSRMWQAQQPRAYVPSRFAVCYGLRGPGDTADLAAAPAVPHASLFGRTTAADRRLPADWPCSVVTTARAARIVEALRGARVLRDSTVGSTVLAFVVDVRSPVPGGSPREARLFLEPLLPDDGWPCSACT